MPTAASTATASAVAPARAARLLPRRGDAGPPPGRAGRDAGPAAGAMAAPRPGNGDTSRVRRLPVDESLLVVMLASLTPAAPGDARRTVQPAGRRAARRISRCPCPLAQAGSVTADG